MRSRNAVTWKERQDINLVMLVINLALARQTFTLRMSLSLRVNLPPDTARLGSADKWCGFHLQTDTFRHRKLYQGYDQNKTPSKNSEGVSYSH
jgi:hypothetical protein